ncbi:MAG: ABC transporter substrate-binding protein [Lachnospiraceae bacterium]|nr:ABC transporter substrate-binding protein [Lachnospiraceae bacterium]
MVHLLLAFALGTSMIAGNAMSVVAEEETETGSYPVTIENNGNTITYESAPERVVVLSYERAEIMAALGLADRIVALAPAMNSVANVMEEYRDIIDEIPVFDESEMTDGVPNLETVLSVEPDFVYGTYYSFFAVNCGASEDYLANDIGIYASDATCAVEQSIDNIYTEIENIGKIFGVEERAAEVIAELEARVNAVSEKVEGLEAVSVFIFDMDMEDGTYLTAGGSAFTDVLLSMAGGENIFHEVDGTYVTVSPEEIIARDPEAVITISYYTTDDGETKINTMKNSEDFSGLTAVVNDQLLAMADTAYGASPGMQCVDALEEIAQFLHPEAFEE